MAKYIDLSSVVDVEPEVCEPLIEDDDLSIMKEILDEIIEDSKDAD